MKTLADQLALSDIPLRGGEVADWEREANLLLAAAESANPSRSLDTLVAYRKRGVPLAYLVGTELFLGSEYATETGVVIPHPASELLALATAHALGGTTQPRPRLLEVGVGVGNITVSALASVPTAEAHCSELQGAALRLTQINASTLLDTPSRLRLYQAYDTEAIFEPFSRLPVAGVDVVAANPPYLIDGDPVSEATKRSGIAHFSYAPVNDPSWFLREIIEAPDGLLAENCTILMECADPYLEHHTRVMRDAGWNTEAYSRESYLNQFGVPMDRKVRTMTPSLHRLLHSWRGENRLTRAAATTDVAL
ncbi:hypothetical protein D8W71_02205 [Rhodococcus sp. P1Y]|nr:hypothetical protein D8W71_02205 [Rhodococcus sp. P1Y]